MINKRILIASAVFPPEPVTSALLNYDLAKYLSDQGDAVTVITPRPSRPVGFNFSDCFRAKDEKFTHIELDSYVHPQSSFVGRMHESVSFGRACTKFMQKHKKEFDLVYNDGWQLFGLYLVAKECVKQGIPYIVPIQDIYPESLLTKVPNILGLHAFIRKTLGRVDHFYIANAAHVRTITESMANYLSTTRKVERKKFLAVANWQDDNAFADYRSPFRKNGKTVFMFVGNNNKQANVDLMIRAFVKANLENAEFRIMGGGNAKEGCISLTQKLKTSNITFGEVPSGMVPATQKEADVMIVALKKGTGKQGLPSKLIAYMLSGKPIIASVENECDTAKIIREANAGIVTEADNVEELAKAFQKMASDTTTHIEEMGYNSRKYADLELSRESNLNKIGSTINNILT